MKAAVIRPETPSTMTILQLPGLALAWLGRQGTRALAVSIFIGLAMPQLADYVKPYLGLTVFVLLLFSYLRTDLSAFGRIVRAPGLAILASLWIMVALPLIFGTAYALTGLRETMPALYTIMILHIAIAPITSSAAFAALMGLDVAYSLAGLMVSSAISPLTTVAICYLFLGTALFSPIELGIKLFVFFAASGAIAYGIHRLAGQAWIDRQKDSIDGLSVIGVFIFAIAAMGAVPHYALAEPLFALKLLGFIVVLTAALVGLTVLVFIRAGIDRSLAFGLLAAFRNLGVVMAALGATLPDTAWFFFALVQFPIYTFPALLKPLARRLQPREQDR